MCVQDFRGDVRGADFVEVGLGGHTSKMANLPEIRLQSELDAFDAQPSAPSMLERSLQAMKAIRSVFSHSGLQGLPN